MEFYGKYDGELGAMGETRKLGKQANFPIH